MGVAFYSYLFGLEPITAWGFSRHLSPCSDFCKQDHTDRQTALRRETTGQDLLWSPLICAVLAHDAAGWIQTNPNMKIKASELVFERKTKHAASRAALTPWALWLHSVWVGPKNPPQLLADKAVPQEQMPSPQPSSGQCSGVLRFPWG